MGGAAGWPGASSGKTGVAASRKKVEVASDADDRASAGAGTAQMAAKAHPLRSDDGFARVWRGAWRLAACTVAFCAAGLSILEAQATAVTRASTTHEITAATG